MRLFDSLSSQFQILQEEACNRIEACDGGAVFTKDAWEKEIGHGITRVITNGNKIEKGAVNFSKVEGVMTRKMAKEAGMQGQCFSATGLSSIFHPQNPFVPAIHLNVRYFVLDNGTEWFGGGIDLTPTYITLDEVKVFHLVLKEVCDRYNPHLYKRFKENADNYFYLKHREETRGVGGIFFDREKPGNGLEAEDWVRFISDLVSVYPEIYCGFLERHSEKNYSSEQKKWQNLRRSRYVEFNLLYDRGTRFGIESGGNTESILISMPPQANWEYNALPLPGSPEEAVIKFFKKGIDWIG